MFKFLQYIAVIFSLVSCDNHNQIQEKALHRRKADKCCNQYSVLKEHFIADLRNENIPLDNIEGILGKKARNIMIVRIFGNYCGTCIDSVFSIIIRNFETEDFIVLASDVSPRYLKYKFGDNFRIIDKNEINIPIEKKQMPYFFFFDKDKISKHVFIVDKVSLELLNEYCTVLNDLYFSKKERAD